MAASKVVKVRQEVYQVSANRGRGKHKLRYVERSQAAQDDGECRMCQPAPPLPRGETAAPAEPTEHD